MTSRTDAILHAVRADLVNRRAAIDADGAIVQVVVTVKLAAGSAVVRGVRYEEERLLVRRASADAPRVITGADCDDV